MKERTRKIAFIFLIAAIVFMVAVIIISLFTAPSENPSENGEVTDEETSMTPVSVTTYPDTVQRVSLNARNGYSLHISFLP